MNIRDIARLADVSPGTVSKVLNSYPDISEATRRHVLKIIAENQYDSKANLRTAKASADSSRIGLVVEGVYNALYSYLEEDLSSRIHNSAYSLVSFHDNYFIQDKQEKLQELKSDMERDKLCGLIYIGGNFEKIRKEDLESLCCPTVFVNTVLPSHTENASYSSVRVSHYETACAQMRYLIDKGHREICTVISSKQDNSVYGLRASGYRATLRQYGLEQNLDYFLESDYEEKKAHAVLLAHLRAHPETTAVCSEADIMIPGILRAIHDAGAVPGKDVEVISFDGLKNMAYCIPSVTTFAQPFREMAGYAYELLFGLINKTRDHQHITFQPTFLKGESC